MSTKTARWKKILKGAAGVLMTVAVLLWVLKAYRDAHYFDNYDPRAPLNLVVQETIEVNRETPEKGLSLTRFTFDGYRGERVPALISLPAKSGGKKLPAVVFLHGIGQNKNFLKQIASPFNQAGFAIASFDQFTQGERKLKTQSFLAQLEAFRQRPAKTVNEARRLIDYLATRPDIDPGRIYLVGASYGAVTGSTLMARDPRLRAGVLVYGGGDLSKLADSYANHLKVAVLLGLIDGKNLNPEKPPLPILTPAQERKVALVLGCIKPLVRYFLGVADPIHYVARISPRPIYFQNGKHDVLVPAAAGAALQEAAREPKTITWYESDHVGINLEHTKRVLDDGLKWLLEQDDPFRASQERVTTELIRDPHFQSGFHLIDPKPGRRRAYGRLSGVELNSEPVWDLDQWSSRFPLTAEPPRNLKPGVQCWLNPGKTIRRGAPGLTEADLSLGVNAITEYDKRARKAGEPWVHLLVEQSFADPPALANVASARLQLKARLLRSEFQRTDDYSPGLHAAQFQMFLMLQNRNRESRGHGHLVWFGIPLYDDRSPFPKEHKQQDTGGTAMFIFTPGGEVFSDRSAHDGQWITVDKELRPLFLEALETAWQRGFLLESRDLADYRITGMNLGWEVPGLFDAEMQVRDLSLKVETKSACASP